MQHSGKALVVLVAISMSACAMDTTPGSGEDGVVENEITPHENSVAPPGGPACAPVLIHDANGELTVKEWLCPVPQAPLPDPEHSHANQMRQEWVTGSSRPPGAY